MKKLYLYVILCFFSHYITPKTIETFDEFITEIHNIDENLENLVDINAYIRQHHRTWDKDTCEQIQRVISNQREYVRLMLQPKRNLKTKITAALACIGGLYLCKRIYNDTNNAIESIFMSSIAALQGWCVMLLIALLPDRLTLDTIEHLKETF